MHEFVNNSHFKTGLVTFDVVKVKGRRSWRGSMTEAEYSQPPVKRLPHASVVFQLLPLLVMDALEQVDVFFLKSRRNAPRRKHSV